MITHKSIRRWIIPALLVLLLLVTTAGVVFHHHSNSTEANCPICHINHQSADLQVAGLPATGLTSVGPSPDLLDPEFVPSPVVLRVPARAPPLS